MSFKRALEYALTATLISIILHLVFGVPKAYSFGIGGIVAVIIGAVREHKKRSSVNEPRKEQQEARNEIQPGEIKRESNAEVTPLPEPRGAVYVVYGVVSLFLILLIIFFISENTKPSRDQQKALAQVSSNVVTKPASNITPSTNQDSKENPVSNKHLADLEIDLCKIEKGKSFKYPMLTVCVDNVGEAGAGAFDLEISTFEKGQWKVCHRHEISSLQSWHRHVIGLLALKKCRVKDLDHVRVRVNTRNQVPEFNFDNNIKEVVVTEFDS